MIDAIRDRISPGTRPPLPTVDLDAAELYDALSCERRRLLIDFITDLPDGIELGNVAEYIAAEENDTTFEALTSEQRKRVYVGLYQTHAPMLDGIGVVEFTDDGVIRATERTAAVAQIANAIDEVTGGDDA